MNFVLIFCPFSIKFTDKSSRISCIKILKNWLGDIKDPSTYHMSTFHSNSCFLYPRGGGVLCLEKGTDCGPTAGEWWLSRPVMAKKGGLSLYHIVG